MNRFWLAPVAALALGASACGSAATYQANPQVRHDEARIQKSAERCARKVNLITSKGRHAFVTCMAPGGAPGVEKCAQRKLASDGVLTKRQRHHLVQDLFTCGVR